jgi:hypothetical protein
MAREGVSLKVIQRQLGHVNLGVTSVYLDGIDTAEIIDTVHSRRAPMISASAGLSISARERSRIHGDPTLWWQWRAGFGRRPRRKPMI